MHIVPVLSVSRSLLPVWSGAVFEKRFTTTRRVFGKRGANPPLPRNCKRGELGKPCAATGSSATASGKAPVLYDA